MEKFDFEPAKTITLKCDKNLLMDWRWLFDNTPWINHDNMNANLVFDEPIDAYVVILDGSDTKSAKIGKIIFDNILVTAFHGSAGNHYDFIFKLGNDETHRTDSLSMVGYTFDEVKEKYLNRLNSTIKGYEYQIQYQKDAIDNFLKRCENYLHD
jgi:hypothetical protein